MCCACILHVLCTYLACVVHVSCMCCACIFHVLCMCCACVLHVLCMCLACVVHSLHVFGVWNACVVHASCMCILLHNKFFIQVRLIPSVQFRLEIFGIGKRCAEIWSQTCRLLLQPRYHTRQTTSLSQHFA
jgi:hypothetical protein